MKRVIISFVMILTVLVVVGCLDYKAYQLPEEEASQEVDLIDEIAAIEEELGLNEDAEEELDAVDETDKEMDDMEDEMDKDMEESMDEAEEVVLPELADEEPEMSKEVPTITVDETEFVNLKVRTSDPDGDKVSYSFSAPLDANGQWQTEHGDEGEYMVTITATDGKLTTEQPVRVVVNRVNVPPRITGVKDIAVKEGAIVRFKPKISDPNGDKIEVTISEPLARGVFKTDHTSSGEYQITVTASDGELDSEESFLLSIEDVNELPRITDVEDLVVQEGAVVEIRPTVTDLDEDQIELFISEPVGDDGVWETAYTDHGTYVVTITANDGKDVVTKNVQLVVEDVNVAPEIVDVFLDVN